MSESYNVRITYMDGSEELIERVTDSTTADGVLTLHNNSRNAVFSSREHLGSYPIHNIRFWKREERW